MTKKNLKTLCSVGPSGLPRAALDNMTTTAVKYQQVINKKITLEIQNPVEKRNNFDNFST